MKTARIFITASLLLQMIISFGLCREMCLLQTGSVSAAVNEPELADSSSHCATAAKHEAKVIARNDQASCHDEEQTPTLACLCQHRMMQPPVIVIARREFDDKLAPDAPAFVPTYYRLTALPERGSSIAKDHRTHSPPGIKSRLILRI